ncbi:hypothetical protein D5018_02635 [Parashewanella curva]|uniref:glutathione gamma-glutamylcysteinyltransferase n=1 Tax=Parashewanella curva TaxID=2338552 RepID=A0A3L8Q0L9_9GAMM|nr:phytochelatin synthase family protein [Parashewanella curva]RLV61171.1 hypothetical protein D5018_02635 [Parashewanella curva]
MKKQLLSITLFSFICSFGCFASSNNLPVPHNLIRLVSANGILQLIRSPQKFSQDYWSLSRYYVTETGLAYCGPASVVMVLNAMGFKPTTAPEHFPYKIYNQHNIVYNNKVLEKKSHLPLLIITA